jgi:type II secretory pathway component PulF
MAALLNSGLTVQQSLNLAGKDCHPAFRRYLKQICQVAGSGQDLATAITLNGGYFDRWTISLIRLAEYSGSLAQICNILRSLLKLKSDINAFIVRCGFRQS